jgi:subtilisin family serine protease
VVSAMPNWLMTAAPFYYADGGPALPPRPSPVVPVSPPANALSGWRIRLLDAGIPLDSKGAEDVQVVVLDTAPHPDRIRSAATRPELRRNWLLQRLAADLRNEDGSFVVEYDRYPQSNDVCTGRDDEGEARYYPMADHGISVAGLIRDVAPRAHIRLVRVLNDYGGGDLYSLFAALTDLEREMVSGSIRRLVINLSLTIMPDIRRLPYIWLDNRQWSTTQLSGVMRVLSHIEEGLRLLFESLHAHGALIVAAAGNDSSSAYEKGQSPRPPRAPARYETTLSVTSVNSNFAPSKFANAANIPPLDSGVATFGGESYGEGPTGERPDAVRGLYISPLFPLGEQNTTGWADWCGSSFATPVISALGAHLMAQGWSASNIVTRLVAGGQERRGERLFGSTPDAPKLLGNIIRVQQRYGL